MKPESVVGIGVALLFACVLGVLGTVVPWPEGLSKPWGPGDWAAWVQAVGSIVAIGAGAAAIRWQVAQDARRERVREINDALNEVSQVHALVLAALNMARADQAACDSLRNNERRSADREASMRRQALFVTFDEAHLDHIRAMNVRLAFVLARLASRGAHNAFYAHGSTNDLAHRYATFSADIHHMEAAEKDLGMELRRLNASLREVKGQ